MVSIDSIPERLASPGIARLYTDIKRTLGVPVTNLLWRHLATIDGALESTWKAIRPLYTSGLVEEHAAQLRNVENLPQVKRWSANQLSDFGISELDARTLTAVIANYDKTNAANLVAIMGLLGTLNPVAQPSPPPLSRPPRMVVTHTLQLPPLILENDMSDSVKRGAIAFNNLGIERKAQSVIAGVPRHLANWPGLLKPIVDSLVPFERAINSCITSVQNEGVKRGIVVQPTIAHHLGGPLKPPVAEALRQFAAPELISNYIVKICLLRNLLPG